MDLYNLYGLKKTTHMDLNQLKQLIWFKNKNN